MAADSFWYYIKEYEFENYKWKLTADAIWLLIDFVYLWIHMDVHRSILEQFVSSIFQSLAYPVCEILASYIKYDIGNILPVE